MANFSLETSIQLGRKEPEKNRDEQQDLLARTIQREPVGYQYVLTLLTHALIEQSQDMAVVADIDPEYLVVKALLASALKLNAIGTQKALDSLERHFPWLMGLLTENLGVNK